MWDNDELISALFSMKFKVGNDYQTEKGFFNLLDSECKNRMQVKYDEEERILTLLYQDGEPAFEIEVDYPTEDETDDIAAILSNDPYFSAAVGVSFFFRNASETTDKTEIDGDADKFLW